MCVVICVELLSLRSYCRRGTKHAFILAGVELLLVWSWCRRETMHVGSYMCGTVVDVQLLSLWN